MPESHRTMQTSHSSAQDGIAPRYSASHQVRFLPPLLTDRLGWKSPSSFTIPNEPPHKDPAPPNNPLATSPIRNSPPPSHSEDHTAPDRPSSISSYAFIPHFHDTPPLGLYRPPRGVAQSKDTHHPRSDFPNARS
ncbi:hypothetical protein FA13DRAFT_1042603 [Coprinellus micaceus]|uniref:Uncharacterized protein n=1 Tax=Coprinellus micaceus TaxID=71717 RepID=A0A4Y7SY24_COPMI|nr:hypothetical protein FA13DRAFT_1042603 [Coprinellus micaceus]